MLSVDGSSQAIRARVAASNDDDALARGENLMRERRPLRSSDFVAAEIPSHSKFPLSSRPGRFRSLRLFRAAGQQYRIEVATQIFYGNVHADMSAGHKLHALRLHLLQAAIDNLLLQLEIGNAITKQSADSIGLLVDRHVVARSTKLLRGSQTSRSGSDNRDSLAGLEVCGVSG